MLCLIYFTCSSIFVHIPGYFYNTLSARKSLLFISEFFPTQHYVVISLSPLCHMSTLTLLLRRHANFLFCVLTISMLFNPCLFNLLLCNVIWNDVVFIPRPVILWWCNFFFYPSRCNTNYCKKTHLLYLEQCDAVILPTIYDILCTSYILGGGFYPHIYFIYGMV